ncbi:MAG: hypothetical protein HQM11_14490 [SAR324 cluster bacterium]|nr:hypothetical protein [SAR324 cluster bacterium]
MITSNFQTGRSQGTDLYAEQVKKVAVQCLVAAWDNYDQALDYQLEMQWSKLLECLFNAIHGAVECATILYSSSLELRAEYDLIRHLLDTKPQFEACPRDYLERYLYWKSHRKQVVSQKQLTDEFQLFFQQTKLFLQCVELFYQNFREQIYYTATEQQSRSVVRWLILTFLLAGIALISGFYIYFEVADESFVTVVPMAFHARNTTSQVVWLTTDGKPQEYETVWTSNNPDSVAIKISGIHHLNMIWHEIRFLDASGQVVETVDFQNQLDAWHFSEPYQVERDGLHFSLRSGQQLNVRFPVDRLQSVISAKINVTAVALPTFSQWLFY